MKKLVTSADQLAGLFVGMLGMVVAIRWVFQSGTIATLIPGSSKMGIVGPLLFMAAGFCCYYALHRGRAGSALDRTWRVLAALVVAVPALVLAQHAFGIDLGIDFVRVPIEPTPDTPHPGRMAPNTCVAFILAGAALHLARTSMPGRLRMAAMSACALLVILIGVTALLGYLLGLEVMYRIAAANVMLPPTAIAMIMLGLGLWSLRSAHVVTQRGPASSESRITWRALGIVTVVALSAGAAGFAAMRDSYEESLSSNMQVAASTSAQAIANTLEAGRSMTENVTRHSGLGAAMTGPDDAGRQARVQQIAQEMIGADLAGVQVFGTGGELLASAGALSPSNGSVRHPLVIKGRAGTLMWDGGYVLRTEHDVRNGGAVVGRVAGERRLALLDRALASIRVSRSSDILLCHRAGDAAMCAPTRFYKKPVRVPMFKVDDSMTLPISHALAGQSGVASVSDQRGVKVMAAYTPVGSLGLGLLVRNDVATLYGPLRKRTNMLLLALAVLVALGASTLLFQVRPLLAQLVREQRRTRVILENSIDAFVAIGIDGRITDWNTQAERTFGWSASEAIGRDMAELIIPPTLRDAHNEGFARFAQTGTGRIINTRIEVMALRRDGTQIPVELAVASFHNGAGYVANAFMRDITERRRLGAEIEARATELEHERDRAHAASRAKGEFVANMSHELRTPMNAVLGMAHLLSLTDLKDEQKRYLEMIRDSGRSLLGIMNDILDFSKVEAGRLELEHGRFLLCDVLGAVATIMSVNAGDKDIELAIGVDPGVPQVLIGDAMRLQQVLVNLAGNAIKFTERGEVSLLVELLARDDSQATLQVRVRDTGIGIDEAHQKLLFSPFMQGDTSTTRRFGGTGLGLTISRHLVGLMHGTIAFDSELGRGSEFRVALPLRVYAEHDDTRKVDGALAGLRLLVVDDHPTSRDYLARTIRSWGWEAECADSGEQALTLVRQARAAFSAVLVDWQMPGMDGVRTMESIRNIAGRGHLPVILMANAYGRSKLDEAAPARRADAILSKPVTGASLYDILNEILVERARGASRRRHAQPANALAQLDGARVLMAEDNELNQAVARGILEQAGARVEIVGDGAQAVARLSAAPAAYDLVLMDIQMPVMDGFEATRRIRSELGLTLPVLAITAGVTESERASYLAAGMDDLIAKPVNADQMVAAIARYLNKRQRFGPAAVRAAPAAVAAVAGEDPPVLHIEPLVALARGNRERLGGVAHLLQRVVDDAGREFAQARKSWNDGDHEAAARALHALRGGVGSIGAKRFAKASHALEQEIKAGQSREQLERQFAEAGVELEAALAAARAWLASFQAGGPG